MYGDIYAARFFAWQAGGQADKKKPAQWRAGGQADKKKPAQWRA